MDKRLIAERFAQARNTYNREAKVQGEVAAKMLRLLLPSLRTIDALRPDTAVYLTHIAPSLHQPHRDEAPRLAREGMILAHDGLTVDI